MSYRPLKKAQKLLQFCNNDTEQTTKTIVNTLQKITVVVYRSSKFLVDTIEHRMKRYKIPKKQLEGSKLCYRIMSTGFNMKVKCENCKKMHLGVKHWTSLKIVIASPAAWITSALAITFLKNS